MIGMEQIGLMELMKLAAEGVTEAETFAQLTQRLSKTTKTNKPYLDVTFAAAEGNMSIKVWADKAWFPDIASLPIGSFVALSGQWAKGQFGMEVAELNIRPLNEEEKESFLTGSGALREKQNRDLQDICELTDKIQDPRLRVLCREFLSQYEERLYRTAAARNYHHARRGGLIEHTASMMRLADAIATVTPELNKDLLLAGCLFHDSGKLWENSYPKEDFVMPYSDVGELLGHIPLGIELINSLWKKIMLLPEAESWKTLEPPTADVRIHLLHLIAAHHGELAFGSPVVPKTPEAFALHYIDNLDAKMEMFRNAYDTSEPLSAHVLQKKMPLPGNVVIPLAKINEPPLEPPTENSL